MWLQNRMKLILVPPNSVV
uniref:SFRICE_037956 n=1 Tax=Spodoptera frugiperda TaxID=7108 RepID=A0A2H1V0M0_SPOFR